jgi:phosphohistidine phosphatase
MRHAKSDWAADFGMDHDRPLNARGVEAARHMGRLLAETDLIPDLVVSSTAVRARSTAELAIEAGGWDTHLELEPGFYGSGPGPVLDRVSASRAGGRLMIVGHQPTWGAIVRDLTGEMVEVKTATVVVIGLPIEEWVELATVPGTVEAVHHPPR